MLSLQRAKGKELERRSPAFPVSWALHSSLGWCSEWVSLLPTIKQKGCPYIYTALFNPFWNELIFTLPRNMVAFLQPTERPLKESFLGYAEGSSIGCQTVSTHVRISCPQSKSRKVTEGAAALWLAVSR